MSIEQPESLIGLMPEGVGFLTEVGSEFHDLKVHYPEKVAPIRTAFDTRDDVKRVLEGAKDFRDKHKGVFNGVLLGNPVFTQVDNENGVLDITAEQLHYFTYFAAHKLRQEQPELGEQYDALSVCGIVFDNESQEFYFNRRPSDAAEYPGMLDAPGGTLGPTTPEAADPYKTVENRLDKKLGMKNLEFTCIGIQRLFDSVCSLYNIAMYAEVDGTKPTVKEEQYGAISMNQVTDALRGEDLDAPAKAMLLLALGQEKFTAMGWGPDKVKAVVDANKIDEA